MTPHRDRSETMGMKCIFGAIIRPDEEDGAAEA